METYYIHDNGGRPFKVTIEPNKSNLYIANVYKITGNGNEDENDIDFRTQYENNPILTITSDQVFIGKSPKNKTTEFSGGYGSEFDGNTILLHLFANDENKSTNLTYIAIAERIFSFKAKEAIVSYVSIVGNNDVPYPYAVDQNGNIYLLLENVILNNTINTSENLQNYDDWYDYYYDYNLITSDCGTIPPKLPKFHNCALKGELANALRTIETFNDINKFYIGNDRYTLRYESIPRFYNYANFYITDKNDVKYLLTREMYIDLISQFGDCNGFEPFEIKIIHERL